MKEEISKKKKEIKERDMKELAKYRKYLFAHPRLRCLFIELTDQCNLMCRHCGSECDPAKSHYIDADLITKAIRGIAANMDGENFMICLTGGEPLLHPDFETIVSVINQCGIPWGMTTNGILIDRNRAERLKELNMGSISISLDGLKEEHEWLRNVPGCFDRAIEGIENLHSTGMAVQITTVVHKKNFGRLSDMYDFVKELGVRSWRVVNIDPIGRAANNSDLFLSVDEIIGLNMFIRDRRYKAGEEMDVCYGCAHYLSYDLEHETRGFYFQCGAGTTVASILWNGDIYGCLDIERRPELVQGNIAKDRFWDVWYKRFQPYRYDRSERCSSCMNCSERRYCGGDSMHTWDFDNNRPRICLWNNE